MMEDDSSYNTVAREHRDDNPTMSQVSHFSLMPTTQTTTVTTTTTVATKFPPVVFKKPRKRLNDWDPTSYPLKDTPTPVSLRRFTFDLDGRPATFVESADTDQALIEVRLTGLYKTDHTATIHHGTTTIECSKYRCDAKDFYRIYRVERYIQRSEPSV